MSYSAPPRPDWERFWPKVDADGDCWEWTAAIGTHGYGMFRSTSSGRVRTMTAHQWAWETLVGPIPAGKQLDHLCHNRCCVNVGAHLRVATPRQQTENGWSPARFNGARSRCIKGHPFDRMKMQDGRPTRVCSTCEKERKRRATQR